MAVDTPSEREGAGAVSEPEVQGEAVDWAAVNAARDKFAAECREIIAAHKAWKAQQERMLGEWFKPVGAVTEDAGLDDQADGFK